MALVTVQRSPSPSNSPESLISGENEAESLSLPSPRRSRSFSENYLAVKGAALILPQSECSRSAPRTSQQHGVTQHGGDIQLHLQAMFHLLRPEDTIQVAVKLETAYPGRTRYMTVVTTEGRQDTEESVILGIDITTCTPPATSPTPCDDAPKLTTANPSSSPLLLSPQASGQLSSNFSSSPSSSPQQPLQQQPMQTTQASVHQTQSTADEGEMSKPLQRMDGEQTEEKYQEKYQEKGGSPFVSGDAKASVGLVLPIWGNMTIQLDGDGGFIIHSDHREHCFKPVSVQAMWSALQSLVKVTEVAKTHSYYPSGLTHTWLTYYRGKLSMEQSFINEWHIMEDVESHRASDPTLKDADKAAIENLLRNKLKEAMMTVDLEEVTSKILREKIEKELGKSLKEYRHFLDEEMIIIMRQMDSPTQIFPFLYLGSEWNASNLEELNTNGIGYILNVTREIDNFFPGMFEYYNIRVYDIEQSDLLKYWDKTYRFIDKARRNHSKVLVHCKMGISRSASTVIAYAMKEYGLRLDEAIKNVQQKRSCVRPNKGFMQQLVTYQGILDASKQRHNTLWRSVSMGKLNESASSLTEWNQRGDCSPTFDLELEEDGSDVWRPRSWSPQDGSGELLLKARGLAQNQDTTDEEDQSEESEEAEYDVVTATSDGLHDDGFQDAVTLFPLDWEDAYDVSSRSADSLDEVLPPSSPSSSPSLYVQSSTNGQQVQLLSYNQNVDFSVSGETRQQQEESDIEDFVADENCGKSRHGMYDISMIAGYNKQYLILPQETSDIEPNLDLAHPDMKMELMMAQRRKQLRTARMLQFSQRRKEQEKAKIIMAQTKAEKRRQRKKRHLSVPPGQCIKTRPDDFWIKDIPPSPCHQTGGGCDTDSKSPLAEKKESSVVPKSSSEVPVTQVLETVESNVKVKIDLDGDSSDKARNMDIKEDKTSEDNDIPKKEIGITHHYQKEDIPWNLGTVKQTTREIEQKYGSSEGSADSSGVGGGMDTPPRSPSWAASSDTAMSPKGQVGIVEMKSEVGGVKAEMGMGKLEVQVDGVQPELGEVEAEVSRDKATLGRIDHEERMLKAEVGVAKLDMVGCRVYALEDINLPPGLVNRTKMEIEQRERSKSFRETSLSSREPTRSVQRSASWKNDKSSSSTASASRFDRNSERRKTCLPVLCSSLWQAVKKHKKQQQQQQQEDGQQQQQEEKKTQEEENGTVFVEVGGEEVELIPGNVRKHTKGYEGLDVPTCLAGSSERSKSPYVQEGLEILSGSVLKTKQDLELKYTESHSNDSLKSMLAHDSGSSGGEEDCSSAVPIVIINQAGPNDNEDTTSIIQQNKEEGEQRHKSVVEVIEKLEQSQGGCFSRSGSLKSSEKQKTAYEDKNLKDKTDVIRFVGKKDNTCAKDELSDVRLKKDEIVVKEEAKVPCKKVIDTKAETKRASLLDVLESKSRTNTLSSSSKNLQVGSENPKPRSRTFSDVKSDGMNDKSSPNITKATNEKCPATSKEKSPVTSKEKSSVTLTEKSPVNLKDKSSVSSKEKSSVSPREKCMSPKERSSVSPIKMSSLSSKEKSPEMGAFKLVKDAKTELGSKKDKIKESPTEELSGLKCPSIVKTVMKELESKAKENSSDLVRTQSLGSKSDLKKGDGLERSSSFKERLTLRENTTEKISAECINTACEKTIRKSRNVSAIKKKETNVLSFQSFSSKSDLKLDEVAKKNASKLNAELKSYAVIPQQTVDVKNNSKVANVEDSCELGGARPKSLLAKNRLPEHREIVVVEAPHTAVFSEEQSQTEEKKDDLSVKNLREVFERGKDVVIMLPTPEDCGDSKVPSIMSRPLVIEHNQDQKLYENEQAKPAPSCSPTVPPLELEGRPRSKSTNDSGASHDLSLFPGVKVKRSHSTRVGSVSTSQAGAERRVRKSHGKSHPLSKLVDQDGSRNRGNNNGSFTFRSVYNTM